MPWWERCYPPFVIRMDFKCHVKSASRSISSLHVNQRARTSLFYTKANARSHAGRRKFSQTAETQAGPNNEETCQQIWRRLWSVALTQVVQEEKTPCTFHSGVPLLMTRQAGRGKTAHTHILMYVGCGWVCASHLISSRVPPNSARASIKIPSDV